MSPIDDEDRTMDDSRRDGWVAVFLLVVIALLALGQHHAFHFPRW